MRCVRRRIETSCCGLSLIETHSFTDRCDGQTQDLKLCSCSDILPHLSPCLNYSFSPCVSVAFLRRFGDFKILSSGPVNHSTPAAGSTP